MPEPNADRVEEYYPAHVNGSTWHVRVKLADGRILTGEGALDPVPNFLDVIDRPITPTLLTWLTTNAISSEAERPTPQGGGLGMMQI